MRRRAGQAARVIGKGIHSVFGGVFGRVVALLLVLTMGAGVLLAGLAWRLSQGPVDLPWLAKRMTEAANAESGAFRISIGGAALTWEGFRLGVDRPLDIRLRDVDVTDPSGGQSVAVPDVYVSLALGGLLLGRIQPRAIEINSARLVLLRTQAGAIRMDFGSLDEAVTLSGPSVLGSLIAELARPPVAAGSAERLERFSQLRRVRIRNSTVTVIDRKLAVVWRTLAPEIDLRRGAQGGVEGAGSFRLAMGAELASVQLSGTLAAGDGTIRLSAQLSDFVPASLARQLGTPEARITPEALITQEALITLDALATLDARLTGSVHLEIGADQILHRVALDLHAGPGHIKIGPSNLLLAGAELIAEGTDRDLLFKSYSVRLLARDGGPVTTISGSGTLRRDAGRLRSELSVAVDRIDFADLPQLWPRPIASAARAWITDNIVAGVAQDGHVQLTIEANEDFSNIAAIAATGTLLAEGVSVFWLRPIPPIDRATARLNILDPDTFEILVSSGRQSLDGQQSGLVIKSGKLRITGLAHKDQVGTIDADIAGPIADAITLLRNKALHLFDRFPLDLNGAGGRLSGKLAITVPFESKLAIEQVPIEAKLHLQDARLAGLVAGRDVERGSIDIVASTEGLKLSGQADIATIPMQVDAEMNFRSGPPSQVLRRIVATGRATSRQLAAMGLDAGETLDGNLTLKAVVTDRRDGTGEILVDADLLGAALRIPPIGWQKPVGQPATAQARLKLLRGRLVAIEDIALNGLARNGGTPGGDALTLRAQAGFADGRIANLTIDRATFGHTSGRGTVRFPLGAGPIQLSFDGSSLDLSQVLSSKPATGGRREVDQTKAGPPWTLDARVDRAIMANATTVAGMVAHVEHDGSVVRVLHVEGQTGADARFRVDIAAPAGPRLRTLNVAADNAGELLRAADVLHTMQGGRLKVTGTYDDTVTDHPLSGTAEISDFRIQGAPALGRLLQAMTLYGLVDVMQGPGLGFSTLVAPFRLTRDVLALTGARAHSPSLGLTVKGQIDLARERLDLQGTIVPAYFFNSLLGNLPLIGRLFSPEEGGGLFAASYSIRGLTQDPEVKVNPLSVLTPGFLRGLFGIF